MGNQSAASATQTAQRSDKQPSAQHADPASVVPRSVKPRKAALLIGCRYKNHKDYSELPQTHRDVFKLKKLLINKYHYDKAKVTLLLDDGLHLAPTRANILIEMKRLVEGARAGDSFFFHYSGHGAQTPCQVPGEEPDGMDEAIVPCDATEDKETWIIDNDLHKRLVRKIPVNSQLIAFFDMCHSGTAMDLKHYCYNENGTIHQYRRTSHDTIEDESRRIRRFSSTQGAAEGEGASSHRKNTRQFTFTKRKSTMHCDLSEGSENGNPLPEIGPTAHRCNSCSQCGGIVHEHHIYDSPLGHDCDHDQQGFVPERPLDDPVESQEPVPQQGTVEVPGSSPRTEHHREQSKSSMPTVTTRSFSCHPPLGQGIGCLSALRIDWLPHLFKRKFLITRKRAGNEKTGERTEPCPSSRVSTVTSLTPLNPSTNPSTLASASTSATPTSATVPTLASRPPRVSLNINRNSIQISTGKALEAIREDAPISRFASEHVGEIPRCTSPISGPLSPISTLSSEASITSSGAAVTTNTPKRFMTTAGGRFRKKCRCRSFSGEQEYGQTITIASSSDEQLAWETSKGTLTSALVSILENDPHPTYKSLLASVQGFLNNMSDDMRRYVTWTKNHSAFKNRRRDPRVQGPSHKTEMEINDALLEAFNPILKQANGGPVQTAIIGTQKYADLSTTPFDP